MFPQQGVIDFPSRQINDFFTCLTPLIFDCLRPPLIQSSLYTALHSAANYSIPLILSVFLLVLVSVGVSGDIGVKTFQEKELRLKKCLEFL